MRASLAFGIAIVATLAVFVHHAIAAPYPPPDGQVWHGVAEQAGGDGGAHRGRAEVAGSPDTRADAARALGSSRYPAAPAR
jgi:hypothetical protein